MDGHNHNIIERTQYNSVIEFEKGVTPVRLGRGKSVSVSECREG